MAYCKKQHCFYGSETWAGKQCPMCGGVEFTTTKPYKVKTDAEQQKARRVNRREERQEESGEVLLPVSSVYNG